MNELLLFGALSAQRTEGWFPAQSLKYMLCSSFPAARGLAALPRNKWQMSGNFHTRPGRRGRRPLQASPLVCRKFSMSNHIWPPAG